MNEQERRAVRAGIQISQLVQDLHENGVPHSVLVSALRAILAIELALVDAPASDELPID